MTKKVLGDSLFARSAAINDAHTPMTIATPAQTAMNLANPEAAMPDPFEVFWRFYPKRKGANPKAPAKAKFLKLMQRGEEVDKIIAGAIAYAVQESDQINTRFIAQTITWLNQRRWEDYAPDPAANSQGSPPVRVFVRVDTPQWEAWTAYRQRTEGRGWPERDFKMDGHYERGWWFETEWPPQ